MFEPRALVRNSTSLENPAPVRQPQSCTVLGLRVNLGKGLIEGQLAGGTTWAGLAGTVQVGPAPAALV